METFVNEKAIQTRDYKNYLFSELIKNAPLHKDQSIRIKVVEGETPFPKITEALGNFVDGKFTSQEIITLQNRSFERRLVLVNYTNKVLSRICTPLIAPEEPKNEKDIAFWFAVANPEKIYMKTKKLGAGTQTKSSNKNISVKVAKKNIDINLHLGKTGDIWREPKNKYCYSMDEKSNRHKIVRFFIENIGYQPIEDLIIELKSISKKTVSNEIGKINENVRKHLKLTKLNFIEGRKGSGYRINSKIKIELINS